MRRLMCRRAPSGPWPGLRRAVSFARYTHAEDKQVYLFTAPVASGARSYIKLRLPEGSTSQFEDVLIQRGCLKDGPAAVRSDTECSC